MVVGAIQIGDGPSVSTVLVPAFAKLLFVGCGLLVREDGLVAQLERSLHWGDRPEVPDAPKIGITPGRRVLSTHGDRRNQDKQDD